MNTHISERFTLSRLPRETGFLITVLYLLLLGAEFSLSGMFVYAAASVFCLLIIFVILVIALCFSSKFASSDVQTICRNSCGSQHSYSGDERTWQTDIKKIALKVYNQSAWLGLTVVPACLFSFSKFSVVFCLVLYWGLFLLEFHTNKDAVKNLRQLRDDYGCTSYYILIAAVFICGMLARSLELAGTFSLGLWSVIAAHAMNQCIFQCISRIGQGIDWERVRKEARGSWQDSPIVGNNRSFIYHRRGCPNVLKIHEERRVGFRSESHAEWWRYKKSTGCPEVCR